MLNKVRNMFKCNRFLKFCHLVFHNEENPYIIFEYFVFPLSQRP